MENLYDYIKPELLVLVPVLYIIGLLIKNTEFIKDKYIPAVLGVCGILLSTLYIIATTGISLMSVFGAITQGVLVTGASVYANQLLVQSKK